MLVCPKCITKLRLVQKQFNTCLMRLYEYYLPSFCMKSSGRVVALKPPNVSLGSTIMLIENTQYEISSGKNTSTATNWTLKVVGRQKYSLQENVPYESVGIAQMKVNNKLQFNPS